MNNPGRSPESLSGRALDSPALEIREAGLPVRESTPPLAQKSLLLRRAFSFPVFLAAVLVGGAFMVASWNGVALGKILVEGDTWWHLATGQSLLATHTFPVSDSYSYTAGGTSWIAYGWLPELLMAAFFRLRGLQGLAFLLLLSSAAFYLLLYYYAWLRSRNAKAAAIACAALLPVTGPFVSPRPQFLAAILFVVTLICLEHFREGKQKALWFLPPVFVLWVNTHGSFLLAIAFIVLCWIAHTYEISHSWLLFSIWSPRQRRQLAGVAFSCLAALCITPYGTRLAAYPFEFGLFQTDIRKVVTEWQPLNLHEGYAWAFIAILLLMLLLQVFRPLKYRLSELLFLLFCAFYACLHARFLLLFGLAAAPIVAVAISGRVPAYDASKDKPKLNAVLIVLILAAMIGLFPAQETLHRAVARRYPESAVRYLREHPPLHLWNEDTWGSYLIWAGDGRIKVFIDGRFDIYEYTGVLSDYLSVIRLERETPLILRKYDVDTALLHRDGPLASYLGQTPGWQRVYQDDIAVVLRRATAQRKQTTVALSCFRIAGKIRLNPQNPFRDPRVVDTSAKAATAVTESQQELAVELSVVMPCLNEAETLATCIQKAQAHPAAPWNHERDHRW